MSSGFTRKDYKSDSDRAHEKGNAVEALVDHERRRLYLSLLSSVQVVDLCLTFDSHTPEFVRATIWPTYLDAAIAASQEDPCKPPKPTASDPPEALSTAPSTPSASDSYQARRFAYASQPVYPHALYYLQLSWSTYWQTSYRGSHPCAPPSDPANPSPYRTNTGPANDVPNYEDMFVEALNDDVRDSKGLAPKDLYAWMASHYPVQPNFRQSTIRKAIRHSEWHRGSVPSRLPYPSRTSSNSTSSSLLGSASTSSTICHGSNFHPPEDDMEDAYEGAEHILKVLNFGDGDGLYTIPQNPEDNGDSGLAKSLLEITDNSPSSSTLPAASTADEIDVETIHAELQGQLILLAARLSEIANGVELDNAPIREATSSAASSNASATDSTAMNSLDPVSAASVSTLGSRTSASLSREILFAA
ncbi:hypothetical protein GYMLUDRAFT_981260 [Collybiopsis luxurians FD-317 M1]|uniref:Uncharacterized protein n=1 Tax=Collybiopsis luxurians FD-317 M1 TaxID=944289 RepID=A0A0D0BPN0_9AGAR|nr:hypothetical protein GYMLUDRAFT_981260 [Collybiopsis luxurians FD-317 M1]